MEAFQPFVNVATLDDLVVDLILTKLDFTSLKKLRMVCKMTNRWVVSNRKCLDRFVVRVCDTITLQEVCNSATKWARFDIIARFCYTNTNSELWMNFMNIYAKSMTNLKIYIYHNWSHNMLLETLGHIGLSLKSLYVFVSGEFSMGPSLFGSLVHLAMKKSLPALEIIDLEFRKGLDVAITWHIFSTLFEKCPNLRIIHIPAGIMGMSRMEPITCALDKLFNFVRHQTTSPGKPSRIDFGPLIGNNSALGYCYPFPLNEVTLLELVSVCSLVSCKLENVPLQYLPTKEFAAKLPQATIDSLSNHISSIFVNIGTDVEPALVKNYFLPNSSSLKVISVKGRDDLEHMILHLPDSANITSIYGRCCTVATHFPTAITTGRRLDKTTELRLVLGRISTNPLRTIRPEIIFQNITKLYVDGDEIYTFNVVVMLQNLHYLRELTLDRCTLQDNDFCFQNGDMWQCSRAGLVVQNSKQSMLAWQKCQAFALLSTNHRRAFLHVLALPQNSAKLPKCSSAQVIGLDLLKLTNCEKVILTNRFFRQVIKFSRLSTLDFNFFYRSDLSEQITMQDGLSCLYDSDSIFRESIQYLKLPRTPDFTNLQSFRDSFRNLRSFITYRLLEDVTFSNRGSDFYLGTHFWKGI